MEVVPKRSISVVKEERKIMDSCVNVEKIGSERKTGEGGSCKSSLPIRKGSNNSNQQVSTVIASERSSMDVSSRSPSPSNPKGSISINQEEQLESTKAEMGEVREENERLKTLLARIVKDYQSLQMHFFDIVQQDQPKKPTEETPQRSPLHEEEPEQLVSLSLGTSSSIMYKKEDQKANTSSTTSKSKDNDHQMEEGPTLGLDCKYEGSSNGINEPVSNNNSSPSHSIEEAKEEEEAGEPWPPSKILKNMRSGPDADEVAQQAHVKKTRVSVRARCDAPTMHDGCQWRKYGQKIAKGNPCPRAYYRCTVAPACPVRKQVQRCAEDLSILITTYEGTHNHPLPISATAMASTTSAAASMLTSGSTTSPSPLLSAVAPSMTSSNNASLHALSFNLSENPHSHGPRPFYIPTPTISSTPSYPTITLDLTSPPYPTSHTSNFTTRLSNSVPRYSSTSFNFSSSDAPNATPWASNGSSYLSYYNKGSMGYQSYLGQNKVTNVPASAATQHVFTDTIAKAITSDPSFQSALAAAITSYVGGGPSGGDGAMADATGCGSSFLTRASGGGSSAQVQKAAGSLMFLQSPPLMGLSSSSKSASASPGDNRESNN